MTTVNIAEIPVVQEHVTVQEIPKVSDVGRIQEPCSFTGLMNPQISTTSLEASQVVDSLPPVEEFSEPVYNQVNQEQIFPACSGTLVFEYAAPALVTEHIAPAPAVTSDAHSQQLPPVYTMTAVTTDDNLDITGLMCPQFSSTAVEAFFASCRWSSSSFGRVY